MIGSETDATVSGTRAVQPAEALVKQTSPQDCESLPLRQALVWAAGAIAAFHLAYASPLFSSVLMVGYVLCLARLNWVSTTRQAAYFGFGVGFLTAAPQLTCFWTLFGAGAIALWSILGFWIGLFVVLGRLSLRHFGRVRGMLLLPILWTGLEFFRSELYPLKFSWLNAGYALSGTGLQPLLRFTGMYGAGFLTMAVGVGLLMMKWKRAVVTAIAIVPLAVLPNLLNSQNVAASAHAASLGSSSSINVAGVQMEFPAEFEVISALDRLIAQHPKTDLIILSEYTFINEGIPAKVRDWCRNNHRYLLVGGKDPAKGANFYDTAFVVGTNGDIVFKQAKCVPVQFMKDGLPAKQQQLWDSPWGKLGICICYDLSYTRVTDQLVRLGARALLIPTMDVIDWGRHEHELHARVAPARATEYGLPVFRVGSSGISQFVDRRGHTLATADFPGKDEEIFGKLVLGTQGRVPLDRPLGWMCVIITAALAGWFVIKRNFAFKTACSNAV